MAGTGIRLRIPFGNKEAAQQLGARYRSGAWMTMILGAMRLGPYQQQMR
jgi:hypothetical protein